MPEERKLWSRGRIVLEWPEGHELHGLEIVMRRRPLGEILDLWTKDDDRGERKPWAEMSGAERAESTRETAAELSSLVVEWNLRALDGRSVAPIGPDSVLTLLDDETITDIWTAYHQATTRVAPPLPKPSGDGQPSETGLSLPMEPLSPSPEQHAQP